MKKILFEVFVCILLIASVIPSVNAVENWTEEQKLQALEETLWFGQTVSLSGDTAVVGARSAEPAVYVFTRTGTTWAQQARLFTEGFIISNFGESVLIGSSNEEVNNIISGVAYVFTRTGNTWTQQARLVPSDGEDYDEFGCSVSIEGNTALIGAWCDDDNGEESGSAYVFTRTGNTWTQQAKLLANDGTDRELFGCSVSLDGDNALIGARNDDDNTGCAYIFTRTGNIWTQQAKLLPSDSSIDDFIGYNSVSLDGNTALIGAILDDNINGIDAGSVYVFTRTGTTWTQQEKLIASGGVEGAHFGESVSLSGDIALIGAYYTDSAYIFIRTGTTWTQQQKLVPSEEKFEDIADFGFGSVVSLDENTALIGAFWGNSVYVFKGGGADEPSSENQPPVPDFTWTPSTPMINQGIAFDASASSDQDGSITKYEWDWNNDGTYENSYTITTATHSWTQAGSYPVKLQVTDNNGAASTKTLTVSVSSGDQTPGTTEPKTPGFELVFVLCAIAIAILLLKKKRNV